MENYSLSDIAAVSEGGLNGAGSSWIIIILFLLVFGGNGFGNRSEFGQYATAASQSEILLGQQFQTLNQAVNAVGDGICSSTFALNNSIKDGNSAVAGTVVSEGRATQDAIGQVRYDMSNFACSINKNIDDKFAALEKAQLQAQIDAQANQLNQLYIAQQMCGVVRYPNTMAYNAGTSPFCNGCCSNI